MSLVSRLFSTGCGVLDEVGGGRIVWGGGVMPVTRERRMLLGHCRIGVVATEGVEFPGCGGRVCTGYG